ncbi:MAG: hypothetical protein CL910_08720 [Deltaproteobacteria bacterium]|jgi:hypothetical protein|nr:hypothetical protein [Deltaproteobacteria bacterium]
MGEAGPHLKAVPDAGGPEIPAAEAAEAETTPFGRYGLIAVGIALVCAIGWGVTAQRASQLAAGLAAAEASLAASTARVEALEGHLGQVQERTGTLVEEMGALMGQMGSLAAELEALGLLVEAGPERPQPAEPGERRP